MTFMLGYSPLWRQPNTQGVRKEFDLNKAELLFGKTSCMSHCHPGLSKIPAPVGGPGSDIINQGLQSEDKSLVHDGCQSLTLVYPWLWKRSMLFPGPPARAVIFYNPGWFSSRETLEKEDTCINLYRTCWIYNLCGSKRIYKNQITDSDPHWSA